MEGLLVPLCIYVILAVSLNLVVGILGELASAEPMANVSAMVPFTLIPIS